MSLGQEVKGSALHVPGAPLLLLLPVGLRPLSALLTHVTAVRVTRMLLVFKVEILAQVLFAQNF